MTDGEPGWKFVVDRRVFEIVQEGNPVRRNFWRVMGTDPDGNVFICPNIYLNQDEAAETAAMLGAEPPSDIGLWRYAASANRPAVPLSLH